MERIMNFITQAFGTGSNIINLYEQVTKLEKYYAKILQREHITSEIAMLKFSIEQAMNGSTEAAGYLRMHGEDILNDIKINLNFAANGQLRMIEESPLVNEKSEKYANEAYCAAKMAGRAKREFQYALCEV